jgi:hypothetical protein
MHDQAFNVGRTSENFQIREVAELVAEIVPDCEVAFAPGASPDARNYRVNFDKITRYLPGYRPKWTLRAGIEELLGAYRRAPLSAEEFRGAKYFRLRTINSLRARGLLDDGFRWQTT